MRIGIVGLGAMGRGIARRLIEAGHELTVWNRDRARTDEIAAAGAIVAARPADALQGDIALSMLFDDRAIQDVLLGADGLAGARAGVVHACLSTVTMAFARTLVDFHAEHGIAFVGAPMLGRPEAIADGRLNFLAAGQAALLDRITPPLSDLGRVWRLGDDPVAGFCAKLAANFMISGAIEAMAEAVAVLKGHGVDTDGFFAMATGTLFGGFVYQSYGPMVAGKAPPVPSGLAMPIKDNASFLAAAEAVGARTPFAAVVRDNFQRGVDLGGQDDDWSTVLARVARPGDA